MRSALLTKRFQLLALAVLGFVLPHCLFASAPHKREARERILALEGQWRTAELNGDVAAMDKLLSDDYLGITPQGEVLTKTQSLDRMRRRQLSITVLDPSDIKIKFIGQVAIVTSLARVEGVNESAPVDGDYRYTRIYHHLPTGVWKITNFEITRVHTPHIRGGTPSPSPSK